MNITSKKIAELANVSRGTVDRVLNNRPGVSPKTRERVESIIKALDYHPNIIGKSLVQINNQLTFGFILTPEYNPFIGEICDGIHQAEKELRAFGVSVDIRMLSSLDISEQSALIDEMVAQKVSGIAMIPLVSDEIAQKIDSLSSPEFPIITFNSQINSTKQLCFVGQDHYNGGVCAANLMGRLIDNQKEIGLIISSSYLECHKNRLGGFSDRLNKRYPYLTISSITENQDRDDLAFAQTLELIKTHPNLGGIYITGGGVTGVANAIKYLQRKDIKLVCHDYSKDTKDLLEEGIIDFAIGQNPELTGSLLLNILFDYVKKNKEPSEKIIEIPLEIATEDIIANSKQRYAQGIHQLYK